MSWWETLHLVTWWKKLGISAIKTGQDAPSWIWCTKRLSFFGGGHIVLQRFVHVRCHFQPLPTKLVFAYFDRGSYISGNRSPIFLPGTGIESKFDRCFMHLIAIQTFLPANIEGYPMALPFPTLDLAEPVQFLFWSLRFPTTHSKTG